MANETNGGARAPGDENDASARPERAPGGRDEREKGALGGKVSELVSKTEFCKAYGLGREDFAGYLDEGLPYATEGNRTWLGPDSKAWILRRLNNADGGGEDQGPDGELDEDKWEGEPGGDSGGEVEPLDDAARNGRDDAEEAAAASEDPHPPAASHTGTLSQRERGEGERAAEAVDPAVSSRGAAIEELKVLARASAELGQLDADRTGRVRVLLSAVGRSSAYFATLVAAAAVRRASSEAAAGSAAAGVLLETVEGEIAERREKLAAHVGRESAAISEMEERAAALRVRAGEAARHEKLLERTSDPSAKRRLREAERGLGPARERLRVAERGLNAAQAAVAETSEAMDRTHESTEAHAAAQGAYAKASAAFRGAESAHEEAAAALAAVEAEVEKRRAEMREV